MYRSNFPHRIKKRQEEAKVRQETNDKRTVQEKLARTNGEGKVYMKLMRKLESQK